MTDTPNKKQKTMQLTIEINTTLYSNQLLATIHINGLRRYEINRNNQPELLLAVRQAISNLKELKPHKTPTPTSTTIQNFQKQWHPPNPSPQQ